SRHWSAVKRKYPALAGRRLIHETVRAMINTVATDLTVQSAQNIREARIGDLADVYTAAPLIGFSSAIRKEQQELKKFLHEHLYLHFRVMRMSNKASHIIQRLFDAFSANVRLLPV